MNTTERKTTKAIDGTLYAFAHIGGKWVNQGMVKDAERAFYANHYMTTTSPGRQAKADAVAFVPFCFSGCNVMTNEDIDANAVDVVWPASC